MKSFFLTVLFAFSLGQNSWAIKGSCEESYVPPHSTEDMRAVNQWATGGAFAIFAKQAHVYFDKCAYIADNPYPALFNFSRATATSCLEMDLMNGYMSMAWALDNIYRKITNGEYKDDSTFQEVYMDLAEQMGFDRYISVPGDNETPIPITAQSCR